MKKDKIKNKEIVEELKGQLARALADYDNLRKRTEEERQALYKYSSQRITARFLPIFDMFEAAQNHIGDSGLAIAIKECRDMLKEESINEIQAREGEQFDENTQDVVEVVEGGQKGKIKEVVLKGYKYSDGYIIRHAKVKVYGGLTKSELGLTEKQKDENIKKEEKNNG